MIDALYAKPFTAELQRLAGSLADTHRCAEPFPHTVIDSFLPDSVLAAAAATFPGRDEPGWRVYDHEQEMKREFSRVEALPEPLRQLLLFLNSAIMLEFLEQLTGIDGLIPDPYFVGGGLHEIEPGGWLEVHADFNRYERLRLDRRINLLLYLNRDWREHYGSHLELWDREMTGCVKRVLPVYNRCVIFNTTDQAFHGHSTPLRCPPDRARRSLALYYYSNGRPAMEQAPAHSTLWQQRPGVAGLRRGHWSAKRFLLRLTPPIAIEAYERLRRPPRLR
jgi:Rps23 Pro-64 3,4-dihydroxylase Tpa1-like proline 4-hydroxylase